MVPITQLVKEHIGLVRKLRRFSFCETAPIVAALSLCPKLHANTIRIEVLQHLVAIACVGKAQPNRNDLVEWLGNQMAESPAARMEDPIEDIFVGCVNSAYGSYRILASVFADGDFWMERLLAFLVDKKEFPPFEMAVQVVLPLLRISDALVERIGLARYVAGAGLPSQKIQVPQWRELLPCSEAVHFSDKDLAQIGLSRESLHEFILTDERKGHLQGEEFWNSSLERYPLIELVDGIIVAAPSSIGRAAIRFLLHHITQSMGGWADTLFEVETATFFVNEVRKHLEIESLNFDPPPWPDGLQPMLPYFGHFDFGKPVIMLTYCTPLSKSAAALNGYEKFLLC